jgi:transposase
MAKCIMVGCDLHDKSMLLRVAVDREAPLTRSWGTSAAARQAVIADLRRRAERVGAGRVVLAYEACGFGFRWHDELTAAGFECYVLAPSKMQRSAHRRKRKTDEQDAQAILDLVRSQVLAGVPLPAVWVPDLQTRDDRELVRQRLMMAEEASRVKVRIRWLLNRNGQESPPAEAWSEKYYLWLESLASGGLPAGAAATLASLLRLLAWFEEELGRLDGQVKALSEAPRYAHPVAALRQQKGVGRLTAMVFLTELGDLSRFANRQQVGSYLGLTPSSFESGQADDRKGHITHQGPSRVRKVLCQAIWSRLRVVPEEKSAYERLVARNPKQKKIAVVARMRSFGVVLWHVGLAAQAADRQACEQDGHCPLSPGAVRAVPAA